MSELTSLSERALIAYLLRKPDRFEYINSFVKVSDINNLELRFIYEIVQKIFNEGGSWTWQSVGDTITKVTNRPMLLEYPVSYLSDLVVEHRDLRDVNLYIKKIVEIKIRKNLEKGLEKLKLDVTDSTKGIIGLRQNIRKLDALIGDSNLFEKNVDITQKNLADTFQRNLKLMADMKMIGTGFQSIDKHLTWGFVSESPISIICGRPSMGKSTFKTNIQANLSTMGMHTIGISLEQSAFIEYARFIAQQSGTPLWKIPRVKMWLDEGDNVDLKTCILDTLSYIVDKWPVRVIEPKAGYQLLDIREAILESRADGDNPKVVFVDLFAQLQDINVVSNQPQIIQKKIFDATVMCKELDFHMCLIVQITRFGREKDRKSLDLSEKLKGSGAYEEASSLLFYVERPGRLNPEEVEDNVMDVIILKQKDGPAGMTIPLNFNKETLLLTDILEDGGGYNKQEDNDIADMPF